MASYEIKEEAEATKPLFKQYKANEIIESRKPRLHNLLQKQPMAIGFVLSSMWNVSNLHKASQTIFGITIFGFGIVITATAQQPTFATVFRVPILTGILFFFSGLLTFLLYRFPGFLTVSYIVNIGSFVVAGIEVILVSVDLYSWHSDNNRHNDGSVMRVLALILGVTLLEMMVSFFLLCFLHDELKREKSSHTLPL